MSNGRDQEKSDKIIEGSLSSHWKRRYSKNINSERWEPYSGWEGGNEHLVFLRRLEGPKIREVIQKMQEELSDCSSYIKFPKYYYHITVKSWKFLQHKNPVKEVSEREIRKVIEETREKVHDFGKFGIELRKVNLFSDVVFIEIKDNGRFSQLNKKITEIRTVEKTWRDHPNYIPHCAVGTFSKRKIGELLDKLEKFREMSFGKAEADSFELIKVNWNKTKFPIFERVEVFQLE